MLGAPMKRVFFGKHSSRWSRGNQESLRLCTVYKTVLFYALTFTREKGWLLIALKAIPDTMVSVNSGIGRGDSRDHHFGCMSL